MIRSCLPRRSWVFFVSNYLFLLSEQRFRFRTRFVQANASWATVILHNVLRVQIQPYVAQHLVEKLPNLLPL